MTRDELHTLCREVYATDKWASSLAADLTHIRRSTAPATVNHWQSGERPVPTWLPDELVRAWWARAERMEVVRVRVRAVADHLEERLELERAEGLDQDMDGPAPRM